VLINYEHDCKSKIYWDPEKSQYYPQHKIVWNFEENYHMIQVRCITVVFVAIFSIIIKNIFIFHKLINNTMTQLFI
jgi:hypothetical protein